VPATPLPCAHVLTAPVRAASPIVDASLIDANLVDGVHALLAVALVAWVLGTLGSLHAAPPSRRWLWAAMAALAAGEALHVRSVYAEVDADLGPGWATVLTHSAGLVAAVGVLQILHHLLGHPAAARRRSLVAGAVALAVAALPWIVDPPAAVPPSLAGITTYYDPTWRSALHWTAFLAFLAVALATAADQNWRHARDVDDPMVRHGMLLLGTGNALGLGYVVAHGTAVVAWLAGHGDALVPLDTLADVATLGPSLTLIVLGAAYEPVGRRREVVAVRNRLRVLRPCWEELSGALPEVSPWPDAVRRPTRDRDQLRWQQGRMITESYDALRRLSGYVAVGEHARITARVAGAGLAGRRADAAVQHLCRAAALHAHTAGRRPIEEHWEPSIPAQDPAAAAEAFARQLRTARRRRVRRVVAALTPEVLADLPPDLLTNGGMP